MAPQGKSAKFMIISAKKDSYKDRELTTLFVSYVLWIDYTFYVICSVELAL